MTISKKRHAFDKKYIAALKQEALVYSHTHGTTLNLWLQGLLPDGHSLVTLQPPKLKMCNVRPSNMGLKLKYFLRIKTILYNI